MNGPLSIFYFIVLIISIIVHEVAHGIAAEREGDPTARMLGRITLNPLKHIDWVGSVLLPLVLIISKAGFVVGCFTYWNDNWDLFISVYSNTGFSAS
jgi:Zn-dependent protease